jgi:trk system potassium uptake protein TrkH
MLIRPEKRILFSYYIIIMLIGSFLLMLPFAWNGNTPLSYIDALFTSASAVCVTGLITVDTAQYSLFGKIVILLMIQAGGLGIIGFSTLYLAIPSLRLSLKHRKLVKDLYLDDVETEPRNIMRQIIFITLSIEFIGAVVLWVGFAPTLKEEAPFAALFHAISSFCNAGFSSFSNNLESYTGNPIVNFTVIILVLLGGLGFMVIRDIAKKVSGKKNQLALHSKIVLVTSLCLLIVGTVVYFALECNNAYAHLTFPEKLMAAFFQSVTPRTAGFDTISQTALTEPSKVFTLPLMLIGASSGSTGGGIKTTTFAVVLLLALFGSRRNGEIVVGKRRLPSSLLANAAVFIMKIIMLIFVGAFALCSIELMFFPGPGKNIVTLVFETFSAFGTVGLSQGVTPHLSIWGKFILMLLMFEGKAGLVAMALTTPDPRYMEKHVNYPSGEVLIG